MQLSIGAMLALVIASSAHASAFDPFSRAAPAPDAATPAQSQTRAAVAPDRADRSARVRSRQAYSRLGARASFALALDRFAWAFGVAPVKPLEAEPELTVKEYLSDTTARVHDRQTGRTAVVVSTTPLRTPEDDGSRPIDLRLGARGQTFAPRSPLVPVELPNRLDRAATLEGAGVSVRHDFGLSGSDADAIEHDGKVFYPSVGPDVDAMLTPTLGGFESFAVLRSVESPELLRLELELPAGARVQRVEPRSDLLVVISAAGKVLARIRPPVAGDATGAPVPVTYQLDGTTVTLEVPHRDRDLTYPVLVDPVVDDCSSNPVDPWEIKHIEECFDWRNIHHAFTGWTWWSNVSTWGPMVYSYGDSTLPRGVHVRSIAGHTFTAGQFGSMAFWAPPDTQVYRAEFSNLQHEQALSNGATAGSYASVGIASQQYTPLNPAGWQAQVHWTGQGAPSTLGGQASAGHFTTWWRGDGGNVKSCLRTDCQPDPNRRERNYANLELRMDRTALRDFAGRAGITGARIYVADFDDPTISSIAHAPGAPDAWQRSVQRTITVQARDKGLGVKWFRVNVAGTGDFVDLSCRHVAVRCQLEDDAVLRIDTAKAAEGRATGRVTVGDASERDVFSEFTLRVDRSGPAMATPTGELYDRRNRPVGEDQRSQGLYDASYPVELSATEGNTDAPQNERSGVKSIDVALIGANGAVVQSSPDPQPQSCASSCAKTRSWTLNTDAVADGVYTVRTTATDLVGNTSVQEWQVTVDRRGTIFHGTEVGGDPASGATVLADEWAEVATTTFRVENDDQVATRIRETCTADDGLTGQCDDFRATTRRRDVDTSANESFTHYRGQAGDEDLPNVSSLMVETDGEPAESGSILAVTHPWQRLPPAAGAQYLRFDRPAGDEPDEPGTFRYYVDDVNLMPVRSELVNDAGTVVETVYWTYAVRRGSYSSYPSTFFRLPDPDSASQRTDVLMRGAQPAGHQETSAAGAGYTPYATGATAELQQSGQLCLASTDRVQHTGDAAAPAGMSSDDPAEAQSAADVYVVANYVRVDDETTCVPGTIPFETADLSIVSMPADSAAAQQWRTSFATVGQAVEATGSAGQRLRGGVTPSLFQGDAVTVYSAPGTGPTSTALVTRASTTLLISGAFANDELPSILNQIQPW